MSRDDLEHDLQELRRWAASNPLIVRLWLFGSQATGAAGPESDIDVAVESDTDSPGSTAADTAEWHKADWVAELQPRLRLKLDLQALDHESDAIVAPTVRAHGRLIYERA